MISKGFKKDINQTPRVKFFFKKKSKFNSNPVVGIVLGTGLGDLVNCIENVQSLDYTDLHFLQDYYF